MIYQSEIVIEHHLIFKFGKANLYRLGPWLNHGLTMANCECHNQRVADEFIATF